MFIGSPLTELAVLRPHRTARISSFDRSGGNRDCISLEPGETRVLAEIDGPAVVTHLWITLDSPHPLARRLLVLRAFWDGQEHPSVESPLGEFFGQGWGERYPFSSLLLAAAPVGGNALVSYFPMPFRRHARLEVENLSPEPVTSFYFYLDYERLPDWNEDLGAFHASYRQELTVPADDRENEWRTLGPEPVHPSAEGNYVFCRAEGRGHFVGVQYYVDCPSPIWYGEGDDVFLVDGEPWPGSAHGTGTEDYFNQSWSPNEVFHHPLFGTARVPSHRFGWLGRTHCYRFHLPDPIRFERSLEASIEHGHANVLTLELASVAYWYQSLPSAKLPPLPGREELIPRPEIGPVDVHRWRDAWRRERGGGALWGNEA